MRGFAGSEFDGMVDDAEPVIGDGVVQQLGRFLARIQLLREPERRDHLAAHAPGLQRARQQRQRRGPRGVAVAAQVGVQGGRGCLAAKPFALLGRNGLRHGRLVRRTRHRKPDAAQIAPAVRVVRKRHGGGIALRRHHRVAGLLGRRGGRDRLGRAAVRRHPAAQRRRELARLVDHPLGQEVQIGRPYRRQIAGGLRRLDHARRDRGRERLDPLDARFQEAGSRLGVEGQRGAGGIAQARRLAFAEIGVEDRADIAAIEILARHTDHATIGDRVRRRCR